MATVRPFRALRPTPEAVERVASVPYDVISSAEARELAKGNDLSFLHVIRPEISLPAGTDEHADEVYEAGRAALDRLASGDDFVQEAEPSLYVYRLEMNGRAQVGIMGLVSAKEYDDDVILKHELTRPDKEDDRLRHILTQEAHAEPVMLTYRAHESIDDAVAEAMDGEPLFDFRAKDYVQHTIWKIADPSAVVAAFEDIDNLYVADGHHRSAAASRAAQESTSPEAQNFLAVLFPMEDMEILPYNRAIKDLPAGPQKFLQQLEARTGTLDETPLADPDEPGMVGVYLGKTFGWLQMTLPETTREGIADTLDVARLGEHILEPLLGITDARTDQNILFIGGIRGTDELERLVDSEEADVAFAMYPTSPEDLLDVSDEGELMPPKSTWFEPKLRSGLLVHRF